MPKPVSHTSPVAPFDQDVGRLDVLVDEAALVKLAQSRGNADGEAQEASHLHRCAEQPVERLAAGILEHQHGPTASRTRSSGRTAQAASSSSLSSYSWARRSRLVRDGWSAAGSTISTRAPLAVVIQPPAAAEDAFAVLPQDLRAVVRVRAVERMRLHLSDSGATPN